MIFFCQGFLTNDGLHGSSILCSCIVSVKLVGNGGVISSILFNSFLHETRQRRQDVNWRVDLFVVELSINEDLAFCDVPSKIWDGMGDIVVLNYLIKLRA